MNTQHHIPVPLLLALLILCFTALYLLKTTHVYVSRSEVFLANTAGVSRIPAGTCEAAQRLAASGVFFGTQSTKHGDLQDSCIAAVIDVTQIHPGETDPQKNPKNYTCVGKNVRIYFSQEKEVVEDWSAAANVPSGVCDTQYCGSFGCLPAKKFKGLVQLGAIKNPNSASSLSSGFSPNIPNDHVVTQLLPAEDVGKRIDEALTSVRSTQYQGGENNLPDVTKAKFDALNDALEIGLSDYRLQDYEARGLPEVDAAVRQNSNYQDLVRLNAHIADSFAPAPDPSLLNPVSFVQYSPVTFASEPSAFTHSETFWQDWRRSTNIEQQTFFEYIQASWHSFKLSTKNAWYDLLH